MMRAPVCRASLAAQWRMIGMGMRGDDPAYGVRRGRENDVQMPCVVRARIEHRHLARPQQISVGPRSRHETRIAGDDAAHARSQGAADPGNQPGFDGIIRPGGSMVAPQVHWIAVGASGNRMKAMMVAVESVNDAGPILT